MSVLQKNEIVYFEPMTRKDIERLSKNGELAEGVVIVSLEEIFNKDYAGFMDLLSQKLIGFPLLMNVSYEIVGHIKPNKLKIKVSGDVSVFMEYISLAEPKKR